MSRAVIGVVIALSLMAGTISGAIPVQVHAIAASASINLRLFHNGWDPYYRSPFGAAPTDSKVTLRLSSSSAVTRATLYYAPSDMNFTRQVPMRLDRHSSTSKAWTVQLPTPSKQNQYTYYFRAQAETTIRWYGDDNSVGASGPGQTYSSESDVFGYNLTVYLKSFKAPPWMSKAVVYQIFPDRFRNGNKKNDPVTGTRYGYLTVYFHKNWNDLPQGGSDFFGGDLQGIIDKLSYLHGLGVNTIYLNPIFLAPSNHKYDTSNYLQVDPEFGNLETFKTLMSDTAKLGMHMILDGVFNHSGSDSIYFNKYNRFPDVGAYQSKKSPYYSWYTFQQWPNSYNTFGGYDTLPQLSEAQGVKNFIYKTPKSVAQYWLQQGAAGWRLDSPDTKSDSFWQGFRSSIKARYPDSVIIGEYWKDALPWLMGNEWDGVINYQFREWVLDFFAHGQGAQNPADLGANGFMQSQMGILSEYPRPALYSSMNIVDSHDVDRILYDLGGNKQALRLVALFQMTWLGAPTIYYGDEAGITGSRDPDDRRTFPWGHEDKSLQAFYSKVIHVRMKYPALTEGSVLPLTVVDNRRVVSYLRQLGKQSIVVALNDSGKTQTLDIAVPQLKNGVHLTDALNGGSTFTLKNGKIHLTLTKMSGRILLVRD
jgi:glycosidase